MENAIRKTGYRLNILAQRLRQLRTKTIGYLLTYSTPNPFFAGLEPDMENEAIRRGTFILIWNNFKAFKR
ncbi:MAG: hypothetical protein AB9891_21290 [Anaerolineaceae bacterium]